VGTEIYIQPICAIVGFGRKRNEIFTVLGRYPVSNSSFMLTFWDILLVGTGNISLNVGMKLLFNAAQRPIKTQISFNQYAYFRNTQSTPNFIKIFQRFGKRHTTRRVFIYVFIYGLHNIRQHLKIYSAETTR